MQQLTQDDKKKLLDSIRTISDYPQPGILFYDITTLLNNPQVFHFIISHLKTHYESFKIDFIAAIESRGFIFGATLAYALGVGFVPIRKKGKLPYTTISEKYSWNMDLVKLKSILMRLKIQRIHPPMCF